MPRGGRRPGAGAPKGNWNALTTGSRSKRLQALALSLRNDPHFLAVYRLLSVAAARTKRRDEDRMAKELLAELLQRLKGDAPTQDDEPVADSETRHQQ